MTFKKRRMEVKFELGEGDFGEKGKNSLTVKNQRMRADITAAGGVINTTAMVTVYGMPLDAMARLTVLNTLNVTDTRYNNRVSIFAGDDDGLSLVFSGHISQAWADMKSPADAKFVVNAFVGVENAIKPVPSTSYRGSIDVETILNRIAAQWMPPLTLENNGVNVQLTNPYKAGTLMDQLRSVTKDADINCIITPDNILAIWPKGGARKGTPIKLSKDTGMVGYPAFTQTGIQVTTIFNPLLVFGGTVDMQSLILEGITGAGNGQWRVDHVSHNLEAEMPGGAWFSEIECTQFNRPVPL